MNHIKFQYKHLHLTCVITIVTTGKYFAEVSDWAYPWSVNMMIGTWSDCITWMSNQLLLGKYPQNLEAIMTLLLNANAAKLLVYLPAVFNPPILCYCVSFQWTFLQIHITGHWVVIVLNVAVQFWNISVYFHNKGVETIWGRLNNLLC